MKKSRLLILVITAFLLLPTGTPEDILVLAIIKFLGWLYIPLVAIVLFLLWKNHVTFEKITSTVKGVFK